MQTPKPKKEVKPASAARAQRRAAAKNAPSDVEIAPMPFEAKSKPVYAAQPQIGGPSDGMLDLAKDLAKFIKENKLSTQVQGKEYVNVEGWQYAGNRLGIVPIMEGLINISSEQEIKYQAKVSLFDLRLQIPVGAGFAICSNKESGKKFYQEFAIASMSQTRAIGKAYRNVLAWIIRAAGYEPTPAEEMEYSGNAQAAPVMQAVTTANNVPQPEMITPEQKGQLIELLNYPEIKAEERAYITANLDRYTEAYSNTFIKKVKGLITERGGTLPEHINQDPELDQLPF